jgi:hypothetical protein
MRRFVEGVDRQQSTLFPECKPPALPGDTSLWIGHRACLRAKPRGRRRASRERSCAALTCRLRTKTARAALARAERSANEAGILALIAEVERAARILNTPAARPITRGIVDCCRHAVRDASPISSRAFLMAAAAGSLLRDLLQGKGILVVRNAGPHLSALSRS